MNRAAMTPLPRKMRSTDFIKTLGIRLLNPETQRYLHMSGKGETTGDTYAWRGFHRQADRLKQAAEDAGEAFPYQRIEVDG